ncbi:MAG: hypothetical protein IKY70_00035 [Bacteroidales bacterium]|nr:hypothetical protein [Bacteroidales bacterium]
MKITATVVASLALILLITIISVQLVLTPASLNRIVETVSKEYINGEVKADTFKVHIFKHFPYITLSIQNGCVISGALDSLKLKNDQTVPPQADTLLKFKYFNVSLSLPQLLSSNINLRRINIVSPNIYAYTGPDSTSNYNILKTSPESDTLHTSVNGESDMTITVNRINISDHVKITYHSIPDSIQANLTLDRANIRGSFSTDINKLGFNRADISNLRISSTKQASVKDTLHSANAEFTLDSLDIKNLKNGNFEIAAASRTEIKMNNTTLIENFPIELNGRIKFDTTRAVAGRLDGLTLSIARIPIIFNGDFEYSPDGIATNNLCGQVNNILITDLLHYLPSKFNYLKDSITSNAALNIDVDINGIYDMTSGTLPSISATLQIPESHVEFKGKKSRINHLETNIKAYYSPTCKDSSSIEIDRFIINGRGIAIESKGKISDMVSTNPFIDASFKAQVYLDTLCHLFPATDGSEFEGTIIANFAISSKLSDLNPYRLGNAGIKGSVNTTRTKVIIPQEGIYAILSGINIAAGSTKNTKDASIAKNMKMLATNSTADSIYIRMDDGLMIAARELRIAGHHAAEGFTADISKRKVLPLNGIVEAKRLDMKGADSVSLSMVNPKINISLLPHNENDKIPVMKVDANTKSMRARGLENRYSIREGGFVINAVLDNSQHKLQKARLEKRLDSLQQLYPDIERDSLMAHHRAIRSVRLSKRDRGDFANEDIDIKVDRSIGEIIRQWQISGNITARSGRIVTPYFPQRTRMENLNMAFTTDNIDFSNTVIKSGESTFKLSGRASGLKRAMLGRGNIQFDGKIAADTINFNQLLKSANAGMAYTNASQAYKDSLAKEVNEDDMERAMENTADTLVSSLFVIPGNLIANINLDVQHGIYSNITLQKIASNLTIKERCLKISDFEAATDAGSFSLNAFYATRNKKDISTGFDLELKDVYVEKFIEATPAIDSLLPMLRSLEGKINCEFAATSQLDTAMNFILPTLKGVARITGENLVLLDGETFALISKKLKFKNRKRNLIDNISVEMLVRDNEIDIFPFMMEMDRYQFAVSGTQKLDLSFDYHISVLHSPIPFRLGVTLFGNMDDFSFKIGKARYKSANLPVYTSLIDSTRINLRDHIANIYKIGVEAALRESSHLQRIEEVKRKNEAELPQEMEQLTQEEENILEQIEPDNTNDSNNSTKQ